MHHLTLAVALMLPILACAADVSTTVVVDRAPAAIVAPPVSSPPVSAPPVLAPTTASATIQSSPVQPVPAVSPAVSRIRRADVAPAVAEDVPAAIGAPLNRAGGEIPGVKPVAQGPVEPWFRVGGWGGWSGARLGLAGRYIEVRMQDAYLSATSHLSDISHLSNTITGSPPVTSRYDRPGGGTGYGAEIGVCVLRGVMVESSGGKPRDVWLGARYAIMAPGDITAMVSGYDQTGEGVTYNGTVSASLTTILFGGWIQGGDVGSGLNGRVSLFAGPAWGRAGIHEDASFNLVAPPGASRIGSYDYTRELRGQSWAFDTGLEVGYTIARWVTIFIEGGYHWARFVNMRDQKDYDFVRDGGVIDHHSSGEFALRPDGKPFIIDYDGFSVGVGLKFNLGWRKAVERRRR
jgi:hypothetical protein